MRFVLESIFLALHVTQRDGEFSSFATPLSLDIFLTSFLFDGDAEDDENDEKQLVRH